MMYLAFVLSLTLSCYCAGLMITWTRRNKFKSYDTLVQELKKANRLDKYHLEDVNDDDKTPLMSTPRSVTIKSDTDGTKSSKKRRRHEDEHDFARKMEIKRKKSARESLVKHGT